MSRKVTLQQINTDFGAIVNQQQQKKGQLKFSEEYKQVMHDVKHKSVKSQSINNLITNTSRASKPASQQLINVINLQSQNTPNSQPSNYFPLNYHQVTQQ